MTLDEFPQGPPLPRCRVCGIKAPARPGGCCLCQPDAKRAPPATVTLIDHRAPSFDYLYGVSHPDPTVEAIARQRAGSPPRPDRSNVGWRNRLDAERKRAADQRIAELSPEWARDGVYPRWATG